MRARRLGKKKRSGVQLYPSASQTFFLSDPFWFQKITTDPHILAHVNIVRPDDKYPELKMYLSELKSALFSDFTKRRMVEDSAGTAYRYTAEEKRLCEPDVIKITVILQIQKCDISRC